VALRGELLNGCQQKTTMKTLLRISICLNLGLAAGLALVLLNGPKRVADPAPPVPAKTGPPANTAVATTPPQAPPSIEPKPFHWSQLRGGNDHDYVKNLRAIGCPESTLRAIVTAEVHAKFQARYVALEKKMADLAGGSWTNQFANAGRGEELKAELEKLPDEETAEINDLLGGRQIAVADASSLQRTDPRLDAMPIAAPMAFQPVNLDALSLNGGQKQAIEDVRKSFIERIGGPNRDPNDPAYAARWRKAQAETDQLMKGMLGDAAYQNYQLQAAAQAQTSPAPAAPPPSDADGN
jgi:hypothetical protein